MTEQGPGLLGSAAVIPASGRFLHNQRIGLVEITDPCRVDLRYLYYLLNSRSVRAQISASASGTKVRHTAPERVYGVSVRIPPVLRQREIAELVYAYDRHIDNNHRRIELLEQAARLLYREWFVHLRFPGHEHTRIVDGVPEGWSRQSIAQIAPEMKDPCDPKRLDPETPYIGLEHIPRRSVTLCEWGAASDVESGKTRFQEGDILFGKIRPYFHKVGFTLRDGITSSDAVVLRPTSEQLRQFALLMLSSDEFVALASKTVREGSKMPRADWKYLAGRTVPVPPASILESFNSIAAPIVAQLKASALANRQLARARDLLLPRLMSGEIEV